MSRYIDADNLINELSAACMPIYEKGITGILGDNSSIADIINEQPTADVQEVKHGEWKSMFMVVAYEYAGKTFDFRGIKCSECGKEIISLIHESFRPKPNYCPSCGARMDGDSNG